MELNRKIIELSEIGNELDEEKNFIEYDGNKYYLKYLNNSFKGSKGGNSNVYLLYTKPSTKEDKVIKISNIPDPHRKSSSYDLKRHGRFINEIKALKELQEKGNSNIVQILFDGKIEIKGLSFPYYVMERADTDLKEYLINNKDIDEQVRIEYCFNIFMAISELHEEGYYHRDIKPDNILLFYYDSEKITWKIGDLGLINHRDSDYDDLGEKIGPFGWLSPEAMNKYLTEKSDLGFDCKIDDKSDIFQLGKLFWFIFQQNVPIGQLSIEDFIYKMKYKADTFDIISSMLSYCKPKRLSRDELHFFLTDLGKKYAVA